MDKEQFYLKLLEEECAEIAQVCSKGQRFGIDNCSPRTPLINNREKLKQEVNDLFAILDLLDEECGIELIRDGHLISEKKKKVERYKNYSIEFKKLNLL